jgi:hypothetical protein
MNKKKCLYICHEFHLKTQSNIFLQNELRKEFELTTLGLHPESDRSLSKFHAIESGNIDLVVIFQLDFLYCQIDFSDIPVVIVPMYDSSGGFPDQHFLNLKGALIVNFSIELHLRCLHLKLNSILWKYYPTSNVGEISVSTDSPHKINGDEGHRVFFWLRNRDQISLDWVSVLFPPSSVDHFHLHACLDNGSTLEPNEVDIIKQYKSFAISDWFEKKEDFLNCVQSSNIFFAPRMWEGIGQGFLESMTNGLCIVAWDAPTHNEYIINFQTGILFNEHQIRPIVLSNLKRAEIQTNALKFGHLGARKSIDYCQAVFKQIVSFSEQKGTDKKNVLKNFKLKDSFNNLLSWNEYHDLIFKISSDKIDASKFLSPIVPKKLIPPDVHTQTLNEIHAWVCDLVTRGVESACPNFYNIAILTLTLERLKNNKKFDDFIAICSTSTRINLFSLAERHEQLKRVL